MRTTSILLGLSCVLLALGGWFQQSSIYYQKKTIAAQNATIADLKAKLSVRISAIGDLKPGTKYYACPEVGGSVSITGTGDAATTGANISIIQKSNGSPCSNVVATGGSVTIKCDPDALPGTPNAPKE